MKVCVFGSYKGLDGGMKYEAVRLGRLLAERGMTVVTGGFSGTMEEVSRGAKGAGGSTIGVTYYKYGDTSGKSANPYVDKEVVTDNVFRRIEAMLESDAFIILPGGTGTLLELAAVLEHINKGLMPPKPVIAVGDCWKNMMSGLEGEPVLKSSVRESLNIANCSQLVYFAEDVEAAVKRLNPENS